MRPTRSHPKVALFAQVTAGWLQSGCTTQRHGVVFGVALAVVVVSLGVLAAARRGKGESEKQAWRVIIGGLGAVAVGSLSEYGIPERVMDAGFGFGLELLGFLTVAFGTVVLGRPFAVRQEWDVSRLWQ